MVRVVRSNELKQQLLPLMVADPEGALLFDADGTLWSHDVGHIVFEHACQAGLLREAAREALLGQAQKLQMEVPKDATSSQLGLLLVDAYLRGVYDEKAAAEMMVWAYAGFDELEWRELTRHALEEAHHTQGLHLEVLELADWARLHGHATYIVSASPRLVVEEASRALGFASNCVAGGVPAQRGDVYESRMEGPLPYAGAKVTAGLALTKTRPWLAAFGDSGFDLEMLGRAALAVGIGEKSALIAGLHRFPNAVRLNPP